MTNIANDTGSSDNLSLRNVQLRSEVGWPSASLRIPEEAWTRNPVDESALRYDKHGGNVFGSTWDPVIAQVLSVLDKDRIFLDYSCGTGQFTERILKHLEGPTRILNVDVSPRYMRIAVDRFRHENRVALRLLNRDHETGRFQPVDNAINDLLEEPGVDILTSTNAIHLYSHLSETVGSWYRILRPGGIVAISTGDMSNPNRIGDNWSLHDTVGTVNELAQKMVHEDAAYAEYRNKIHDDATMTAYLSLRNHVYPAVKPIELYLDLLSDAGLRPIYHFERTIDVSMEDLLEALLPYHDVVLGWIGGSRKVEGHPPTDASVRDRMSLIQRCVEKIYANHDSFRCAWTYITAKRR